MQAFLVKQAQLNCQQKSMHAIFPSWRNVVVGNAHVLAHASFDSSISTNTFLRTIHSEGKLARTSFPSNTSSQTDFQNQHSIGQEI